MEVQMDRWMDGWVGACMHGQKGIFVRNTRAYEHREIYSAHIYIYYMPRVMDRHTHYEWASATLIWSVFVCVRARNDFSQAPV